ncbi:hypothetical protein [Jatrophihabitans fulvus]
MSVDTTHEPAVEPGSMTPMLSDAGEQRWPTDEDLALARRRAQRRKAVRTWLLVAATVAVFALLIVWGKDAFASAPGGCGGG